MKNGHYKIFVINPGSTSTKIALIQDTKKVFQLDVDHDANELKNVQVSKIRCHCGWPLF